MQKQEKKVTAHLFICCRSKQGKPCCAEKDAQELVQNLKTWTKKNETQQHIKISQSSCLGHCENGITACLYPQNRWFTGLSLDSEEDLKSLLSAVGQS